MRQSLLIIALLTFGACATPPPKTDVDKTEVATLAYPAARTVDATAPA